MKKYILTGFFIAAAAAQLVAQNPISSTGKEFYVAFGKNDTITSVTEKYSSDYKKYVRNVELILRVTTVSQTNVDLHFAANPLLDTTYTIGAGTIYDIHLNLARSNAAYSGGTPQPNMKSIRVNASAPIGLVALSTAAHSVEATAVFPVENLGKNHIHVGMTPYTAYIGIGTHSNGYTIVATEDNTIVSITASAGVFQVPSPITLNKGGVYAYNYATSYQTSYNPIGTKITADKPIAVFQNTTQGQIQVSSGGSGVYSNNYMLEQIPPIEQWGKRFIVPTNEHEAGMVRVYGRIYPTKIEIHYANGQKLTDTLKAGDFNPTTGAYRDIRIDGNNVNLRNEKAVYITSDNPVGVCFYHIPKYYPANPLQMSQPGTTWLPPIEQRTEAVLISPLDIDGTHVYMPMNHYMLIIAPTASKGNTTISINGGTPQVIPDSIWKADNVGGSGYSFGRYYFGESNMAATPQKPLNTTALIENSDGVIVLGYGQGSYTNYFYQAGAGARDLSKKYSISGTVSGLPNNENIVVKYTINGGNQQVVTTTGGNYKIDSIPVGANVVILASEQIGYVATVTSIPNTDLITSNIIGKNIMYKENTTMLVEYVKVFNCHDTSEIDILAMMRHGDSHGSYTFKMIEQPKYADSITGLNANHNLVYNLNIGFQGVDNLKFSFACDGSPGKIDTVLLYVFSIDCPDNITNATCSDTAKKHTWDVNLRSKTRIGDGVNYSDFINEMDVPLVGDIYGTGEIKILAAVSRDPGVNATDWLSEGIAIFDGKTGAYEKTISVVPFHTGSGTRAIAKVNGKTKIFIASGGGVTGFSNTDNHIVCYDLETGTQEWISDAPYVPAPGHIAANILVADMNASGNPEVIAGNKIFNAATGRLLLDMSTISGFTYGYGAGFILQMEDEYNHLPYFPAVADMANDGVLEFVAGYNIYKIHIPADANSTDGASIRLHRTIKPMQGGNLNNVGDGATVVADLDGDGYLDVIVTRNTGTSTTNGDPYIYAWNGKTGEMFGNAINIAPSSSGNTASYYGHGPSIPVVGDIDGCGKPEICVSTSDRIHAFKYNEVSKKLEEIATYQTNENSGAVAMTMFDFNQNGKMNLVFHDYERLHIFSLQGNTFVDLLESSEQADNCITFAQNEYPIVADVTGDGRANIIVFGSDDDIDAKFGRGYVYIFEGTPEHPWAPARQVWNQWAYNAVNINNDLTIPKYQANPAIMYLNGSCGKVHPYNGFLQQQTLIDNEGCFVWTLPSLQWLDEPQFTMAGDSVVITGTVRNNGDASLMAPLYITLYKNSIQKPKVIQLDSINRDIYPGDTVKISCTVKNISSYSKLRSIIIGVNDKNGDFPNQMVCTSIPHRELRIMPSKNYIQMLACQPSIEIDGLSMNQYNCDINTLYPVMIEQPKHAAPISNLNTNRNLSYFPNQDFRGMDSIEFYVYCGEENGIVDHIKLFITVIDCPDIISDADCFDEPPVTAWGIDSENYLKSTELVNSYGQPYAGDVDGCGKNEVVIWNTIADKRGPSDAILIFDDSLNLKYTIPVGGQAGSTNSPPDLALAFAKTNPANTAADIFAVVGTSTGTNSVVKCFEFNNGDWTQKWTTTTGAGGVSYTAAINIGDINNDGNVMLYVDYKIFNASTGALLLTLPTSPKGKRQNSGAIMNLLADMDNNGTLDAVAATCVYKLNITNYANETGNSYSILYQLPDEAFYNNYHPDGWTSVADINLDGYLDVIVSTNHVGASQRPGIFVWNTQTDPPSLVGDTIFVPGIASNTLASRVFVGDVDNCGRPELVAVSYNKISCFKLSEDETKFNQKWSRTVNDDSAATYMCMFDFNQDGKQEIVYRDEKTLHIIDGETGLDKATIPCFSPTTWEGAIVADLSGDGHAQIIVTGNDAQSDITTTSTKTHLRAYTSSVAGAWGPARPVWNQYSYNAVNINEDLSVPRYQVHPSTVLSNGKRPFNGFLKQQTLLNKNGDLLWTLPKLVWVNEPVLTANGDSITVSVKIANVGSSRFRSPVYVTMYKNSVSLANIIKSDSINNLLNAGDTLSVSFTVNAISAHFPIEKIIIGVNEKETIQSHQQVCEPIIRKEMGFIKPEYPIWNWADLAYINVLIENEKTSTSPKMSDYGKFVLMQDLGVPGKNNYGTGIGTPKNGGINCTYTPSERQNGYYGYQNFIGNNPSAFNSATIYNNILEVGGITTAAYTIPTSNLPWNTGGWEPLGNWINTLTHTAFVGFFEGQGFEINGLWINRPQFSAPVQGLFAVAKNSTIQNLGVNFPDSIISYTAAAGLVAMADFTTITNCYTTGAIRITDVGNAGGLVSRLISGVINNSYSTCDLINNSTTDSELGGLVALAVDSIRINNSYATGNISYARSGGGLVGSIFSNLINLDDPQPDDHTNAMIITNCYATGNVTGFDVGGLVGEGMGVKIINSYATGDVIGDNYAGGIAGTLYANGSEVNNCYATGSVTGDDFVGGLVGRGIHDAIISNSFAFNLKITATSSTTNVGRVIGNTYSGFPPNLPTVLSNNYAFECTELWVNGVQQTSLSPAPAHNNENGLDINLIQATTQGIYTTSPNNWDFTNTWIHSPYNANYKVVIGNKATDLPILRVFDINANNGFFANAEQPPHVRCLAVPKITIESDKGLSVCADSTVIFRSQIEYGGTNPTYQWKVNGNNAGSNVDIFTYIPSNNDVITCELTSDHPNVSSNTAISNALIMTVIPSNTITLTSAVGTDAQTRCVGTAITNITYSTTGATGATITGLPAGITGNWSNNVVTISGTPTGNGNFIYTITLTGGCGKVTKTGTIVTNPIPVLNTYSNITQCAGINQYSITFGGTNLSASVCTWTNSNTAIGLASSGTGNIPSFVTANTTNMPITSTITMTPVSLAGCVGTSKSFIFTVKPIANGSTSIAVSGIDTLCAGETTTLTATAPTLTGNLIFKWYPDLTSQTLLHTGNTYTTDPLMTTTTFYVTVEGDNYCAGANDAIGRKAVKVIVNPILKPSVSISIE